MIMMAMGFTEILMLVFVGGGGANADLASILPAPTYFKSRNIDINVEKAIELAAKDPTDGKTQIAQLVALNYLADENANLKASPNYAQHRQLLEQIAMGRKAQDPQGFAKDYAATVLARLEGAKLPRAAAPSLREDSFRWFPAAAKLLAAHDMRLARGDAPVKSSFGEMFKMFPQEMLTGAFGVVEKIGNVRIDRIAFAFVEGPPDQQQMGQIYIRISGKANAAWLLEGFKELNMQTKTIKGPQGETITTLLQPNRAPGVMLVGDTDVVIAGFQKDTADHEPLLNKVLELRNGKEKHAGEGFLKNELAKLPEKACGLFVGSLPAEAAVGAPFPLPVMISAHILRTRDALDVNFSGAMANEADAKQFVEEVAKVRKQGIDGLKQLQNAPAPIPGLQIPMMMQMLESMQVEAQGSNAKMRMLVPDDMLGAGAMLFGWVARPVAPPAAK
jgi:hypothetical protein